MESQVAPNADSICELNRYLRPRSGRKNSWWFRRRVPTAIIKMVGQSEWRWGLKARNRDDAVIEAMPRFIETEAIIKQAERGDWPPMSNVGGMTLAKHWAAWVPPKDDEDDGRDILGAPIFHADEDFVASIELYLAEKAPLVQRGTTAYECILAHGRTQCVIPDKNGVYQRAGLHLRWTEFADIVDRVVASKKSRSVVIVDADPENTHDLVAEWASWRQKPDKTKYSVRAMMERLVAVTGINDLTLLTRQHAEDWIKNLRDRSLSDRTVAANFDFLRILSNFAIETGWITESAVAKIRIKKPKNSRTRRSYTGAEARLVLERARQETIPHMHWLPWICCFTGCRLEEAAGAAARDIEQVGPYWVLDIRLDHRPEDASIKTGESLRRVPLHPALVDEGFIQYRQSLKPGSTLFPELKPDRFGSKGGVATKRIGPMIRGLADQMPSLGDPRLSPSHSWRHRLHDEFRRADVRKDIEDAIIGHASDGSGPGYGEYAIIDMLGPAIEKTRSPFDVEPA